MQLEEKGKEMTDKLKGAIDKLNDEASALEVEKEKKEVSGHVLLVVDDFCKQSYSYSQLSILYAETWEGHMTFYCRLLAGCTCMHVYHTVYLLKIQHENSNIA